MRDLSIDLEKEHHSSEEFSLWTVTYLKVTVLGSGFFCLNTASHTVAVFHS